MCFMASRQMLTQRSRHLHFVLISDNWEAFYYPIGDARKALDAVAALIDGVEPSGAEKWGEELLQ